MQQLPQPQQQDVELHQWQGQQNNAKSYYPSLPVIETTDDKGDTSIFRDSAYSDQEAVIDAASSADSNGSADAERATVGLSRAHYIMGTNLPWPCGMTNFHFSLCVGCICFLIFWVLLLLRIYLPSEYFE